MIKVIKDVRGCVFEPFSKAPLRLVSLVPSTTETLFALGRGEDLVGYTRFCVHPQAHIRREKWIGGTKNPKINQIWITRRRINEEKIKNYYRSRRRIFT